MTSRTNRNAARKLRELAERLERTDEEIDAHGACELVAEVKKALSYEAPFPLAAFEKDLARLFVLVADAIEEATTGATGDEWRPRLDALREQIGRRWPK